MGFGVGGGGGLDACAMGMGAVAFCDLVHILALWPLTQCRGHTPCVVGGAVGDLGVWAMGK